MDKSKVPRFLAHPVELNFNVLCVLCIQEKFNSI